MVVGRSSAMFVAMAMMLSMFQLFHFGMVHAATYTVGDGSGWSFDVSGWPHGKIFKAGDILVFKYSPGAHNVAVVDEAGYDSCTESGGGPVYSSGNDQVTLAQGQHFFICSKPGHCLAGMKIAVIAN